MTRDEFKKTKVGDKVIINGNSKFKGQMATIVLTTSNRSNGRCVLLKNENMESPHKYHYKCLKISA
jgi:hypothetical protein